VTCVCYANIDDDWDIKELSLMDHYFFYYDPCDAPQLPYLHRILHIFFHGVQNKLSDIYQVSSYHDFHLS
jgi:hypothetical protein